jgi:hypothetical protein
MAGSQDSRWRSYPSAVRHRHPDDGRLSSCPVCETAFTRRPSCVLLASYAALAPFGGHGDVYEVALHDPMEPDGIDVGGDSVCAPSAAVIRIVECHVDLHVARQEIAAEILRHAAPIAADSAAVAPCPASSGLSRASPASLPADPVSRADRATRQR